MYRQMEENYTLLYRWNLIGFVVMFVARGWMANLGMCMMWIGCALHHREKYRQRLRLTVTCEGLIVDDVHVKPKSLPTQRQRLVVDYDNIIRCSVSRDILPFYPLHTVYVSVIVTTTLPDDRIIKCFPGSVLHFGIPSLSEAEKFVDLVRSMMERSITTPVAVKNVVDVEDSVSTT
jgi:hypothetical protein